MELLNMPVDANTSLSKLFPRKSGEAIWTERVSIAVDQETLETRIGHVGLTEVSPRLVFDRNRDCPRRQAGIL